MKGGNGYMFKLVSDNKSPDDTYPTHSHLRSSHLASTTTHGVVHSYSANGQCKRLFWLVLTICSLTALAGNLALLVQKYLQFLPSTRITIYNNRTLPFPAVTICNTNPIKGSAVANSPRLVALLDSWGVTTDAGNTTQRKKRFATQNHKHQDPGTANVLHNVSKRDADEDCIFEKLHDVDENYGSACAPSEGFGGAVDCFQTACDTLKLGLVDYNTLNMREGSNCNVRQCDFPITDTTLLLQYRPSGKDIYKMTLRYCALDPCVHGECTNLDSGYSCDCHSGYEGTNCELETNECESSPCLHGGTCSDVLAGYICACPDEVYGDDCSLDQRTTEGTTRLTTDPETTTELLTTTTEGVTTTTKEIATSTESVTTAIKTSTELPTTTYYRSTTTAQDTTTLDTKTTSDLVTTQSETSTYPATTTEYYTTTLETTPIETTVTTSRDTTTASELEPTTTTIPHDTLNEEFLREEELLSLLAETETDIKRQLSYSLNDMMMECSYDGQVCTESDFNWFFNGVYGNCYIFNSGWDDSDISTELEAKHQGDRNGLTLVLDIGQHEYIKDVGDSAGMAVVVHTKDRMPFPEDEGILATPGKLTDVPIKLVDVETLPEPHGECLKDIARNISRTLYEDLFPVKYSSASCYRTCYQMYMVESCGCGDPQYPIEGRVFGDLNITPCNLRNQTQDNCRTEVTNLYLDGELSCDCADPCIQTSFEYKVSSLDWPAQVNEESTLSTMRQTRVSAGRPDPSYGDMKRNLLKIRVFYETLSYKKMLEFPSYRLAKLFWDIGGILGLWLGCSVFSIIELLELALDSLVLLCYRTIKRPDRNQGSQPLQKGIDRVDQHKTISNTLDNNSTTHHIQTDDILSIAIHNSRYKRNRLKGQNNSNALLESDIYDTETSTQHGRTDVVKFVFGNSTLYPTEPDNKLTKTPYSYI